MKRRSRRLLAATVVVVLSLSPLTFKYLALAPEHPPSSTVPVPPFAAASWHGLMAAGITSGLPRVGKGALQPTLAGQAVAGADQAASA